MSRRIFCVVDDNYMVLSETRMIFSKRGRSSGRRQEVTRIIQAISRSTRRQFMSLGSRLVLFTGHRKILSSDLEQKLRRPAELSLSEL